MSYVVGYNEGVRATLCEAAGFLDDLCDCYGGTTDGEEAYRLLQLALLERPALGDVIPGAGGLPKIRWPGRGHGKRRGYPDTVSARSRVQRVRDDGGVSEG